MPPESFLHKRDDFKALVETVADSEKINDPALVEKGQSLSAEDEGPFPFRLLHFRRTFVEKMFAIPSKVELL